MSSIKRDVKKKVSLDRRARKICLEIQPTSLSECLSICARGFASELSSIPVAFDRPVGPTPNRVIAEPASETDNLSGNHGSYRRLVAYRYLWLSEEA